jgi:excisionase family DNA binding protein
MMKQAQDSYMPDKMLTVPEAAARLRLSPAAIRAWVMRRRISYCKLGRSVRISESEITRLITAGSMPAIDLEE